MFSKDLYCIHVKKQGSFEKGLTSEISYLYAVILTRMCLHFFRSLTAWNKVLLCTLRLSKTRLSKWFFGMLCSCMLPSVQICLDLKFCVKIWMDLKIIWHNRILLWVDEPFEDFIQVGQRSRSCGLKELSLEDLQFFIFWLSIIWVKKNYLTYNDFSYSYVDVSSTVLLNFAANHQC